jgi:hypothetical protein
VCLCICLFVCLFRSLSFFLSFFLWLGGQILLSLPQSLSLSLSLFPTINGCWKFLLSPTNWPEKNRTLVPRERNERLTNICLHDICRCFCSSFSNVQIIITNSNATFLIYLSLMTARKYYRATTTPTNIVTDFTSGSDPQMSRNYLSYNHVTKHSRNAFRFQLRICNKNVLMQVERSDLFK